MTIKKTKIKYEIDGKDIDVDFYIGNPAKGEHPVGFQQQILKEKSGGRLKKEASDLMEFVKKISDLYKISFGDVFDYLQKTAVSIRKRRRNIKKEIIAVENFMKNNNVNKKK